MNNTERICFILYDTPRRVVEFRRILQQQHDLQELKGHRLSVRDMSYFYQSYKLPPCAAIISLPSQNRDLPPELRVKMFGEKDFHQISSHLWSQYQPQKMLAVAGDGAFHYEWSNELLEWEKPEIYHRDFLNFIAREAPEIKGDGLTPLERTLCTSQTEFLPNRTHHLDEQTFDFAIPGHAKVSAEYNNHFPYETLSRILHHCEPVIFDNVPHFSGAFWMNLAYRHAEERDMAMLGVLNEIAHEQAQEKLATEKKDELVIDAEGSCTSEGQIVLLKAVRESARQQGDNLEQLAFFLENISARRMLQNNWKIVTNNYLSSDRFTTEAFAVWLEHAPPLNDQNRQEITEILEIKGNHERLMMWKELCLRKAAGISSVKNKTKI